MLTVPPMRSAAPGAERIRAPSWPTWPTRPRCAGLLPDVRQATDRLDVLVSNAGIGGGEPDGHDRRTSADG